MGQNLRERIEKCISERDRGIHHPGSRVAIPPGLGYIAPRSNGRPESTGRGTGEKWTRTGVPRHIVESRG